ncbi:CinA family protein [Acetobacter sp.]|uniref:CinA family protein n=1 Tax=Acetobacter sp. TaxID=440 RepID=UPI0039E79A03
MAFDTPTLLDGSMETSLLSQSAEILGLLRSYHVKLVTAESCTGGLLAALLTHHAGSSDVTEGGLVTYSNELKMSVLGVRASTLSDYGAVSAETVKEMVSGALGVALEASIAISISGIAGPSGGSEEKPVGLVWFGIMKRGKPAQAYHKIFSGHRAAVRSQAAAYAFTLISACLTSGAP